MLRNIPLTRNYWNFVLFFFRTTGGYGEFIYELEKTFFHLVQSCVDTGMKQQYAFKPMNATKRRIVHELADFYGLDSQSYDEEPMKHVVVFGYRCIDTNYFLALFNNYAFSETSFRFCKKYSEIFDTNESVPKLVTGKNYYKLMDR